MVLVDRTSVLLDTRRQYWTTLGIGDRGRKDGTVYRIFLLCPFLPVVHWDGRTVWDTPISSEATELGRQFGVYSVHFVLTCVLGQ